uniref:Uncharacterized protein n=1 Tax=Oryzias latipes TaxID=8090 RepID=H2MTZ8_ORYLA
MSLCCGCPITKFQAGWLPSRILQRILGPPGPKRFIYLASVSSTPFRPVLLTLSEPARSTRWSLDRCRVAEPGSRLQRCTVKMQWERVEGRASGARAERRFSRGVRRAAGRSRMSSKAFSQRNTVYA